MSYRNYSVDTGRIVDTTGHGDFLTLTAAMAASVSGDTIVLRNDVTENVTITPGVNIVSWGGSSLNTPTIIGTLTMTGAGTSNILGVRIKTNGAALVAVTGSAASILNLKNCYLDVADATAITFSTSNSVGRIRLLECQGDITTTGITLFSHSSNGRLTMRYCNFSNSGGSTTASTCSSGILDIYACLFGNTITTSGTATLSSLYNTYSPSGVGLNLVGFTMGGSGGHGSSYDIFSSGSASALSVSTGCSLNASMINVSSTNTNAVTGAGSITYDAISFPNSSSTINTTTQVLTVFNGGQYAGRTSNTAPSAGMIGEQIRATVATGSPVTLTTTATNYDVASISLTPGIWDVSCIGAFNAGAITGTLTAVSISTTSATSGTSGDNLNSSPIVPTASSKHMLTIPSYRISLSATTTVYMVMQMQFTVGSPTAYGRISATRVA